MIFYILILALLLSVKADLTILPAETEKPHLLCKVNICRMMWLPVCGTNGKNNKTFGNKCAMDKANCFVEKKYTLLNDGICKNKG